MNAPLFDPPETESTLDWRSFLSGVLLSVVVYAVVELLVR
jgi:hypothetical protein